MEDKGERYCTIEESLIEACKEVNLMRKGLLPEQKNWREWIEDLRKEYADELSEEEVVAPKKKVAVRW